MAARLDPAERDRSRDRGFHELDPEQGLRLLGDHLAAARATVIAANIDWPRVAAAPGYAGDPWFGGIGVAAAPTGPGARLRGRVAAALRGERADLLRDLVDAEVKAVLGVTAEHLIDPEEGFTQLGMDSLAVVELRSRLQDGFAVALPATFGFDHPTVAAAAAYLLTLLAGEDAAPVASGGHLAEDVPDALDDAGTDPASSAVETAAPEAAPAECDDPIATELALLEHALRPERER